METERRCQNSDCRKLLLDWDLSCPFCDWVECRACGFWYDPRHYGHLCPQCQAELGATVPAGTVEDEVTIDRLTSHTSA